MAEKLLQLEQAYIEALAAEELIADLLELVKEIKNNDK